MDKKRIRILRIGLALAVVAIAVRLFWIQIIQHDEYVAKAAEEHVSENVIEAERGEIYMMDGQEVVPVVLNETVYSVIFDPLMVNEEKAKEVLEKYAKDKLVAKWEDVFSNKMMRYYVVARNVNYEMAKKIQEEELSGVSFEKGTKRVYVEGEMASGVLGFVNADGEGQYGVEGAFNEELSGVNGTLKAVRDASGVALSIGEDNVEIPAVDGKDVVLTIDRNIETNVEKILSGYINGKTEATNASAVVLDPQSGKVLAMANVPTYNPADYGNVKDIRSYMNNVTEVAYEPASVCKTFTFAAAIDLGVMTAGTLYNNTGKMTVDTLTFENAWKGQYGTISMQTAFDYSLNTGSATALMLIGGGSFNEGGRQKLYDYYQKFGLGQYTGIELFESAGFVPGPNAYDYTMDFTYANTTFGQGMNLTMLQVAAGVASVINGGNYYEPTIVAGEIKDEGFVEAEPKAAVRKTISEETSAAMRAMMWGTRNTKRLQGVDKAGYYIGGKTGTGQVVQEDGSYSEATAQGETVGGYVGFGGTEGELPRYVVMIKLWGDGIHIGGEQVVPVFDEINEYLLNYLKIQPKV